MTAWQLLALFVAAVGAGTINTVVGSGTLITFPVLLAIGFSPVTANVSNTVGLVFGSITGAVGYRSELTGQRRRVITLGSASLVGGIVGAIALLSLPDGAFSAIVPVLIVIALVLVIVQPRLSSRLAARSRTGRRVAVTPMLWGLVLATGVYGGYFGAAQGVLLVAIMAVLLDEGLQRINAVKNVLAAVANGIAALIFIASSYLGGSSVGGSGAAPARVDWTAAGTIAVGAIVGGLIGARVGRRLPPAALRAVIVLVGVAAMVKLLA